MSDTIETAIISPPDWTQVLDLSTYFDPSRPLEVDVGCGKGRFLIARAAAKRDCSFLGIERLLVRLRRVDKKIRRFGLDHVRLLRIEAAYAVEYLLPEASVSTFYIFFPDPWPKRRHHRRRLFSPEFRGALHRTLVPGGHVHVATDHLDYFAEIQKGFAGDDRFEETTAFAPTDDERTDFELIFVQQGAPIGRASYRKAP